MVKYYYYQFKLLSGNEIDLLWVYNEFNILYSNMKPYQWKEENFDVVSEVIKM